MSANAGEIRARLIFSTDEFNRKMQGVRDEMKNTSWSAQQMDKDFATIQKGSTIMGGAIMAAIGGSVKVASEFEQSMAQVQAISGSTAEEFAKQEAAARKMGAETIFSASEAAEGLSYLAMAGFDVEQQIGSLPAVLNAAIAGNISLGDSANIVTNIMSAFGLTAEESGRAVDVLAKAANSANTDIPLMGEAFKMVAPVANALGWSIEETAVAIGELGNVGIAGSQAGTVLRAALLALANPTGQTAKAMKDLKIEVLDAEGNMKGLPELMGHIAERMEGMTEAQKTQTAAQLVGTQAASGLIALLEVGEEGLRDFTKELENSEGAAQKMADVQADTLVGSFKEFQSAMEEAGIKLGNEFIPEFRKVVEWGTKIVSSFGDVEASQVKTMLAFGGSTAAIALTITTLGRLVLAVRGLMASMGPAGWLIAGLSVLGGLIFTASMNSEDLRDKIERLDQEFNDLKSLDEKVEEFDKLQASSRLTADQFARYVDLIDEINRTTDPEVIERLKDEQIKLAKESGLSNDELDTMVELNNDLVEIMPESISQITDQGNAIIGTTDAIKEYSKEKLESLYLELDMTRLQLQQEYKQALEEEARLIRRKQEDLEKVRELQDVILQKEEDLVEQQKILNEMKEAENLYSDLEIKNQEIKVRLAEEAVENAKQNVAEQAESVLKWDEKIAKQRETIDNYEEVRDQLTAVILHQAGLNAEKGKGLETVQKEIQELEKQRRAIERNAAEEMKVTEGYQNSVLAIDKQIESLRDVENKIKDLQGAAGAFHREWSRTSQKYIDIWYRERNRAPVGGPHLSFHEGGIVDAPPKLHDGGAARRLFNAPLHNEIDARLLRNEIVLTEGQQANLWSLLENRGLHDVPQSNENYNREMIELLKAINYSLIQGLHASITIGDREVAKAVTPQVTRRQEIREEMKKMLRGGA